MRQSRVFAAVPGALQRNAKKIRDRSVSGMRRQIGACQAQIVRGVDIQGHRQWVGVLEGRISRLKG